MRHILGSVLAVLLGLPGPARSQPDAMHQFLETLPVEDRAQADPYLAKKSFDWCDPELGCAKSPPFALTILVRDQSLRLPCYVHRIGPPVKTALFEGQPDFRFRVVFAVGGPDATGQGTFADPRSHWFNIFFGYYAVTWGNERPFAYEDTGGGLDFRFEDLVRLGEADWNYFSNRIYGVPQDAVEQNDDPDLSTVEKVPPTKETIGKYRWDVIELKGVSVVSPYRAEGGPEKDVFDVCLTPVWRWTFGEHDPVPSHTESYFPVRLRARGFACWEKLDAASAERLASASGEPLFDARAGPVYRTHIFGGTVNMDFPDEDLNERFLARQLKTLRATIRDDANLHCDDSFLDAPPP